MKYVEDKSVGTTGHRAKFMEVHGAEELRNRIDAYFAQAERTSDPKEKGYCYCQAGVDYKRLGDISSAVGCYLRSLGHDWHGATMYSLAKCLMIGGKPELAWRCYTVTSLMPNFNASNPSIYLQCGYAVLATFEDEFVQSKYFLHHMYLMSGGIGPDVELTERESEAVNEVDETIKAIGRKYLAEPINLYKDATEFINATVEELNKLKWKELRNIYLNQ